MLLTLCSSASAHHSVTPYDQNTFAELQGVIAEVRWRNPHMGMTLLVENEQGVEQEWKLEGDSIDAVMRQGLTRESLNVGDRIRMAGWPSLRGSRELFAINVLLPSGEEVIMTDLEFPLRWTAQRAAADAPTHSEPGRGIFRVWSFGALYAPRKPFVYTPRAQSARADWDPSIDMLALQCIPPGMPNAILNPYPIEFIDEGDRIRVRIEEWEATRIIDLLSTDIPLDAPSSPLGYSVGQWEADTLVIRTAHVDFPYLDDEGTPMSNEVEMIERFTVSEDGSELDYEITVTDPRNLVEPAVWDSAWSWVPGTEIRPFECDTE